MDNRIPEQSPNKKLTALLLSHLKREKMTPAMLAKECEVSKSTVSRILKGIGSNGKVYRPTLSTLEAITRVLRLNETESVELFMVAYPEFHIWKAANAKNLTLVDTNIALGKAKYPTLSKEDGI